MPISRSKKIPKPPWWTAEVYLARSALKRASRNRRDPVSFMYTNEYSRARNKFTTTLRKAKKESWRRYTTEAGTLPWGSLYKWLKKGSTPNVMVSTILDGNNRATTSAQETVESLLNTLIPNSNLDQNIPPLVEDIGELVPCSLEEIKSALWRTSPGKAPRFDGITARIARRAWPLTSNIFIQLMNDCLRLGYFPNIWKKAEVIPILKDHTRSPLLAGSYRPVSLLPVYGKVLERIICGRILNETSGSHSGLQYGFVQGRSTEDAIEDILEWHKNPPVAVNNPRDAKHSIAIFLDITGAFDNLDWVTLISDALALGCSAASVKLISSYLSGRTAKLTLGGASSTVSLTRGCPQGSIFGPTLWNITMEALLKINLPGFARIQAYADDIAVFVHGGSRVQMKQRAELVLDIVREWGLTRKLNFSTSKSQAVILRGTLVPGFYVNLGEDKIKVVDTAKYLGVWIDQNATFRSHVRMIRDKDITLFSRLRGSMGKTWGMKRENALLLYKAVFLPKITYAAKIWVKATQQGMFITGYLVSLLYSVHTRASGNHRIYPTTSGSQDKCCKGYK